jgi:NitT/TauT family transport system ATP-binding protein
MARWGQTSLSTEALKTAMAVFRPDLYDVALRRKPDPGLAPSAFTAFAGPAFTPEDIAGYLAAFKVARGAS